MVVTTRSPKDRSGRIVILGGNSGKVLFDSLEDPLGEDIFPTAHTYIATSSDNYEVTDVMIANVDSDVGLEIVLVANNVLGKGSPSQVIILKMEDESSLRLAASYWHLGGLRKVQFLQPEGLDPVIVVLGENPLLRNEGDLEPTVVFALSGQKLQVDDCWNETAAVAVTLGIDHTEAEFLLRSAAHDPEGWFDVSRELGCGGGSDGLLWYRWVVPSDVRITDATVVLANFPVLPHQPFPEAQGTFEWIIRTTLSDGCVYDLTYDGQPRGGFSVPLQLGTNACNSDTRLQPSASSPSQRGSFSSPGRACPYIICEGWGEAITDAAGANLVFETEHGVSIAFYALGEGMPLAQLPFVHTSCTLQSSKRDVNRWRVEEGSGYRLLF